jgi:hypothetical protein
MSGKHPCPIVSKNKKQPPNKSPKLGKGDIPPSQTPDYYSYRIGSSSLFSDSLGLGPDKDSVITSPQWYTDSQYCPNGGAVRETRNRLEAAVAIMSNGPFRIGDGYNQTDINLLRRSIRADGLLLRPHQSATDLDWFFQYTAFINPSTVPVSHPQNPTLVDPVLHFTFSLPLDNLPYVYLLLANSLPIPGITYTEIMASIGMTTAETGIQYFWAWEANTSAREIAAVISPATSLQIGFPNDEWSFKYFTLVPVTQFNTRMASWILLGEVDKWITASEQRFVPNTIKYDAQSGVSGTIEGAEGEIVNLVFAKAQPTLTNPVAFLPATCKIGAGGSSNFHLNGEGTFQCN